MGFLEENGNTEVYRHLTKPDNSKINQKWTLYLAFCCITVCFGSFQFGYNIGSLNLITPVMKNYFDQVYFKELFHDKLAEFREGEEKVINGSEFFNEKLDLFLNKSAILFHKEKELYEGNLKRARYVELQFDWTATAEQKRIAKEKKEEKEKEIREKYNMSVEEFFDFAEEKLAMYKKNWTIYEKQLLAGLEKLQNGSMLLKEAHPKIIDGRRKLNFIGHIIWGITNSLFVIGGLIGALSSKSVLDNFGRRNGIIFHYLFSIIGSVLLFVPGFLGYSKFGPLMVKLGRFSQGIQGGMSCSLIPVYLSEIAPTTLKGQTGVIHNLFLTMGLLCAQFFGFEEIIGTSSHWNYLLSIPFIPAVIGGILLLFVEETPKFLLFEKSDENSAINALQKLRNTENVSTELTKMYVEGSEMSDQKNISIIELLRSKELRWPLISGVILQFAQQFCGINAIFFYLRTIIEKTEISSDTTYIQIAVLLTGLTNVFCTFICFSLVDKIGRKPLLVTSMGVMIVDLCLLIVFIQLSEYQMCANIALFCIIIFIISYAVGLGPIPFIFVAEAFKQNARSSAMSLCVFTNWYSNLFLVLFFPLLIELMKGYVFGIFVLVVMAALLYIIKIVPETKGRSCDETHNYFNKQNQLDMCQLKNDIHA